jgi:hypothetical protein
MYKKGCSAVFKKRTNLVIIPRTKKSLNPQFINNYLRYVIKCFYIIFG